VQRKGGSIQPRLTLEQPMMKTSGYVEMVALAVLVLKRTASCLLVPGVCRIRLDAVPLPLRVAALGSNPFIGGLESFRNDALRKSSGIQSFVRRTSNEDIQSFNGSMEGTLDSRK
jgi:hypothetical protein